MPSTIRFWLAACGLSVAPSVGFAQMPPPKPPAPVETISLPPVERLDGKPPSVKAVVATPVKRSEPTAWPTPTVIATDMPAVLPRVAPLPILIPDATPNVRHAVVATSPTPLVPETAAACETCAAPGGKRDLHEKCTYTKYGNLRAKKIPPALAVAHGIAVRDTFERQRQLALAEYFVVYREDFLLGTADLNATGLRHVNGIFKRLDMTDAPIKVEPTGLAELDERRRLAVIEALIQEGADSGVSERIKGGTTRAEGLRYEDVPSVGSRNPLAGGGGFGGGGMSLNGSGGGAGGGGIGGGSGGGGIGGGFGGSR